LAADSPEAARLLRALHECPDERVSFTIRVRHEYGTWCWVECTAANHLQDPPIEAIVCNFRDVTERHVAGTRAQFVPLT